MKGFTGKILCVNLTTGQCETETIPESIYYDFLSGTGLAVRLLYERIPAGADPLGSDNILVFASGLLTGTGSLFTGRWMAAAKSPLTGTWGDANCGGNLSPAIKQCGFDAILISGASKKPVYLYVDNKGAKLLPADDLWGLDAIAAEETLISRSKSKKKPAVACIGTAGEKLSLISGICNDRGRIAARSGLGAVMGSKKLKAVALAGSRPIHPYDREKMKTLSKRCRRRTKGYPMPPGKSLPFLGKMLSLAKVLPPIPGIMMTSMFAKWGTTTLNQFSLETGDAPVKNWLGSLKDYPRRISKKIAADSFLAREKERYHCYSCPLGCGSICNMPPEAKASETHKPEYETVMAFGGLLLNNDLDSIFHINDLLNRAGMDTISAGGTVAFAMECFEKGIITKADTGGIDLSWAHPPSEPLRGGAGHPPSMPLRGKNSGGPGIQNQESDKKTRNGSIGNTEAILALVKKMINREGIGDILADGSAAAAKKLGRDSAAFAVTAGGQELAMHDPRFDPGFGLHAGVEATPGRHTVGAWQYYELSALWKRVKSLPRPKPLITVKSKFRAGREKAVMAAANSCFNRFYNGAGLCLFAATTGVHRVPIFEWVDAATGWNRSPEEYMEVGRRIQTLMQLFNIKQGIEPLSIKVNPRAIGQPPLTEGPNKGRTFDLHQMTKDYWREIGWDPQNGKPTPETIAVLGLDALVKGEKIMATKEKTSGKSAAQTIPAAKGKKPQIDKKRCVSCAACVFHCPVSCLYLRRGVGKDAHLYPELVDAEKCISCNFCAVCCPVDAISMV
ncbi:MAG: aldehyde ferredoxin oxidoreductase [Candidatus Aminicenantes bacterium]|nr:aldehyde ferredoxin oxidoreductase [Candidatus Aminicenantes bacterium]